MYDKLMIVAHPDDEIIFGGASLILEKGWKVICVTNRSNRVRKKEFQKAMKAVHAKYEIWNFPDKRHGSFNMTCLRRKIKSRLQERAYSKIVTHGFSGEYGHPQHKALSEVMLHLAPNNLFIFHKSNEILHPYLLREKLNVLKMYKSQRHVIKHLADYIFFEGLQQVK